MTVKRLIDEAVMLAEEKLYSRYRNEKLSGDDQLVMDLLRDHFYIGIPKETLHKTYSFLGKPSFINRILSEKTGVDTSRKNRVRNIFQQWFVKIGRKPIFQKHDTFPEERKKHKSPHAGFGLLKERQNGG